MRDLLDAHRYTRGLDLLPPGTATNVTEAALDGAGALDVGALFDAEFSREDLEKIPPPPRGGREAPAGGREAPPGPVPPGTPAPPKGPTTTVRGPLLTVPPADAVALALGIAGETAADLAAAAADPEPALARAANQALWPATWGSWLTDPMSIDGAPMIDHDLIGELREWFVGNVRADGPLPTLRVGRQPYGLLPVTASERHDGGGLFEHLENFLLDLLVYWSNFDGVPVLDPDSTDVPPDDPVEEQASEVGEIYGATPHLRELRLRTVDDTQRELSDLYDLRLGFAGLLCALMPKDDGTYHTPEDLSSNGWYSIFLEHEPRAQGGEGVLGQLDALRSMIDDLDSAGGNPQQEAAELAIRTYLSPYQADRDDRDDAITGDVLGMVGRHHSRDGGRAALPGAARRVRRARRRARTAPVLRRLRGGRHRDRRGRARRRQGRRRRRLHPRRLARERPRRGHRLGRAVVIPSSTTRRTRCRCCTSSSSTRRLRWRAARRPPRSRRDSPACATISRPAAPRRSPRSSG